MCVCVCVCVHMCMRVRDMKRISLNRAPLLQIRAACYSYVHKNLPDHCEHVFCCYVNVLEVFTYMTCVHIHVYPFCWPIETLYILMKTEKCICSSIVYTDECTWPCT